MIHRGKIVERIVRKSGYSITKLAERLGISRNTLYNRFAAPQLKYRFIIEIGAIIHYDFTFDFPEIKDRPEWSNAKAPFVPYEANKAAELWRMEGKYSHLLEKYDKLLTIVMKLADENGFYPPSLELT